MHRAHRALCRSQPDDVQKHTIRKRADGLLILVIDDPIEQRYERPYTG